MAPPPLDAKELERHIAVLRQMAEEVEKVVRASPMEGRGKVLGMGADGTDTKHIDKVAEDVCLRILQQSGLKCAVVSEEAGALRGESEWTIVMDPLDGTTNAVMGIPMYCVSLALGYQTTDNVVYGIVRNVCTGDVYEATKGQGATMNGKPIKARKLQSKEKPTLSVVFGKKTDEFALTMAQMWANVRSFGVSALECCLVAQGALDAYYHGYPSLRVTDVAAGMLILREAGGEAFDGTFKRLTMDLSLEKRAAILACGDRTFAERAGAVRR